MNLFELQHAFRPTVQYGFIVHQLLSTVLWSFNVKAAKITPWLSVGSRFKPKQSCFYKNKVAIFEGFKEA